VPKLALLQKYDPATFERIASIYEAGERAGRPQGELIGEARDAFSRVQQEKLAHAPDDLVLAAVKSTIAVARDLEISAPDACAAMFLGGTMGDIKPFLSPSTIVSEDRVYEDTLRARKTTAPVATEAEELAAIGPAMNIAAKKMQLDIPTFIQVASGHAPAQYVCRAQAELLSALHSAEPSKAASIFRRRFASVHQPASSNPPQ